MTLDNLVKIKQLNREPPDKNEFEGLVKAAVDRLDDSQVDALSFASRFDLASWFSVGSFTCCGTPL